MDAIRQIKATEGVRGLYKAYAATVFSFGPFSALYFMFYETFKGLVVDNDPEKYLKKVKAETEEGKAAARTQEMTFTQSMLCSMVAGAIASTITNPLDMGKLRMQVQRAGKQPGTQTAFHYKHLGDAIYKIVREEGARALFNGSLARIMFHVPNVAISMSLVEMARPQFYTKLEAIGF